MTPLSDLLQSGRLLQSSPHFLPALLALSLCLGLALPAAAATYYVSTRGDDRAPGTSPEQAWQTLERVNAAELRPGDRVLLRRGDSWRGSLRPRSGDETGSVTYGAYGAGAKPLLLGSVSKSRPEDWRAAGDNLWVAGQAPALLTTAAATGRDLGQELPWGLHSEGGAAVKETIDLEDGQGGPDIQCTAPGTASNHIQFIQSGLKLQEGKAYRFDVRARSTQPFALPLPTLMSSGPPWKHYSSEPPLRRARLGTDYGHYVQYYVANATVADGRLTFYLGARLPAGATLYLRDMSFTECPLSEVPEPAADALPVDVGNIIFDGGKTCGVKVWEKADLKATDQYWYDEDEQLLYVCSPANPAARYRSIECALARHLINEGGTHHAVYENLALMYGAAHGIGGGGTHHITVRDCDFGFIGGADQYGGERRVRFGNGIEFWGDAHDNLVERCRLWEIYDAALTNQNAGSPSKEYNLIYRDNVIWNSEYSFEFWNSPETSETYNLQFVNNTCVNAGGGWGHSQRADPSGRHLCFYNSKGQAHDIIITGNIFCEATKNAFYAPGWSREQITALRADNNLWLQKEGVMISAAGKSFSGNQFAAYQAEFGGEPHSQVGDPQFEDAAACDFRLKPTSPARVLQAGAR